MLSIGVACGRRQGTGSKQWWKRPLTPREGEEAAGCTDGDVGPHITTPSLKGRGRGVSGEERAVCTRPDPRRAGCTRLLLISFIQDVSI